MNKYGVVYKGKLRIYFGRTAWDALYKFENQNKVIVKVKKSYSHNGYMTYIGGYAYTKKQGIIQWVDILKQ